MFITSFPQFLHDLFDLLMRSRAVKYSWHFYFFSKIISRVEKMNLIIRGKDGIIILTPLHLRTNLRNPRRNRRNRAYIFYSILRNNLSHCSRTKSFVYPPLEQIRKQNKESV